ncbi:hypothetical protein MUK42_15637 [Musa troglodytarum]|uniref:Uncharacterized protein n=1 Tax=Musa troglodytarum TaxID=320322 RepID=A0A9E7ENX1_9LILI|nr:hypothetical protein MUK42_15637 [Musa troglodytarum]
MLRLICHGLTLIQGSRRELKRQLAEQWRVSGQVFPLSLAEEQAVRGLRRKLEVTNTDGCAFKRRRDAQLHPSPFERAFSAVSPICNPIGDGMDLTYF